jgi:uncharacterized membrane protein
MNFRLSNKKVMTIAPILRHLLIFVFTSPIVLNAKLIDLKGVIISTNLANTIIPTNSRVYLLNLPVNSSYSLDRKDSIF